MNIDNNLTLKEQAGLVVKLSVPAILAQITSIVMQYIDAGMVGNIGADASASIGLMSTSTWLLGGLCSSASTGFSVQVAQFIGSKQEDKAKQTVKLGLICALFFSVVLMVIGILISGSLPHWLGGNEEIYKDAMIYFLIFAISLPALQLNSLIGSIIACSGNMKVPSILNSAMCILDVIYNAFFIFPTREMSIQGYSLKIYGMGMGVMGAAIGTAMAELTVVCIMLWFLFFKSPLSSGTGVKINNTGYILKRAVKIATPVGIEHTAICGAMVLTTRIVAPLGVVAIAANSFGITAESLCYMPGYGIASAATTLVGQSFGAGNYRLSKKFSWMCVALGICIMTVTAVIMYFICPWMMSLLTPDKDVAELATKVLRIELFAEPLFGASIVASGALRGAGDTLIPSILNLISMWGVRLSLSFILAAEYGLTGVWFAMCVELCVRGILLLIRLKSGRWIKENERI